MMQHDPRFAGKRPDFTAQIEYHLDKLRSLRLVTTALIESEQIKRILGMSDSKTLIKGLSEAVAAAKLSISQARAAPVALFTASAALKTTCDELTAQVKAMHDDIKFEATQLGNGSETASS